MNAQEALLESWTRQAQALINLVGTMKPEVLDAKPSPDGSTVAFHLAHVHTTRRFWHARAAEREDLVGESLFTVTDDDWIPSKDLAQIEKRLRESEELVRGFVANKLAAGSDEVGQYDHPVLFLQHLVWHEGWHYALITLALRNVGAEPPEEWEEKHVWELWRGVEVWDE